MLKFVVSGINGKMGNVVKKSLEERENCEIVGGIDINPHNGAVKTPQELETKPDVIIDFSHPSALENLLNYSKYNGVALVLATTGYNDSQISLIKKYSLDIPVFFSWNMSLGINLMMSLVKKATEILCRDFDVEIVEKHHNQKIDAPSGTALMLADVCKTTMDSVLETPIHYEYDRHSKRNKRPKNEIGIHSLRGGTIVGEHEVIFAGHDEIFTLTHSALSKEIFATGAVNAAFFLAKQPPGLYSMDDIVV